MNQEEILKALIPSIQAIDGGCAYCISEFIATANDNLAKGNCPYRYTFIDNDFVEVVPANDLLEKAE